MKIRYFHFLRRARQHNRSQSLAEFTMLLPIMLTLVCGVFDYGRMIMHSNILAMVTREAANTASRQPIDAIQSGLDIVVRGALPRMNFTNSDGGAIITYVKRPDVEPILVQLVADPYTSCLSTGFIFGGDDALKNKSRILWSGVGGSGSWLDNYRYLGFPSSNLGVGQKMYVVEVFYTNQFVSPIGNLLGLTVTPILYDAAFF